MLLDHEISSRRENTKLRMDRARKDAARSNGAIMYEACTRRGMKRAEEFYEIDRVCITSMTAPSIAEHPPYLMWHRSMESVPGGSDIGRAHDWRPGCLIDGPTIPCPHH